MRRKKGQSLVETMTGFFLLIPLAFLAVDVAAAASTSQQNEQFALSCARLASGRPSQALAEQACQSAAQSYPKSSIIASVTIVSVSYNTQIGQVSVTTNMMVNPPIPTMGIGPVNFSATATQPIVATPAPS